MVWFSCFFCNNGDEEKFVNPIIGEKKEELSAFLMDHIRADGSLQDMVGVLSLLESLCMRVRKELKNVKKKPLS